MHAVCLYEGVIMFLMVTDLSEHLDVRISKTLHHLFFFNLKWSRFRVFGGAGGDVGGGVIKK